jgi:hypothetical protein
LSVPDKNTAGSTYDVQINEGSNEYHQDTSDGTRRLVGTYYTTDSVASYYTGGLSDDNCSRSGQVRLVITPGGPYPGQVEVVETSCSYVMYLYGNSCAAIAALGLTKTT